MFKSCRVPTFQIFSQGSIRSLLSLMKFPFHHHCLGTYCVFKSFWSATMQDVLNTSFSILHSLIFTLEFISANYQYHRICSGNSVIGFFVSRYLHFIFHSPTIVLLRPHLPFSFFVYQTSQKLSINLLLGQSLITRLFSPNLRILSSRMHVLSKRLDTRKTANSFTSIASIKLSYPDMGAELRTKSARPICHGAPSIRERFGRSSLVPLKLARE